MFIFSILCLHLYAVHVSEGYKILVVFPTPGKSHNVLANEAIKLLLEAGHEVTYITSFPKASNLHPSLREIDTSSQRHYFPDEAFRIDNFMKTEVDMQSLTSVIPIFQKLHVACLENENVTKLLNNKKEQFDVVILEWMIVDLISGISAVFNCPYIWFSTVDLHWMMMKLIDELPNPAYSTSITSNNAVPLSFLQRAEELLQMILVLGLQYFYVSGHEHAEYERLLAPIIRKRGLPVPEFDEVRYNVSLVLGYSHVSLGQPTRLPQNYKAVGGYHITPNPDPLSADLKKLLDDAKDGLIYFSLGSMAKSKYFPTEVKVSLLKMFGNLKQTVLWKLEEDLPDIPSNVHIIHWAPQQSILAHPNCILFITHGGQLSTTEAIHFGKPIIGIPVFADQFTNIDRFVKRGIAKRVHLSYTMADEVEKAIHDILNDTRYSSKVKELSLIYHDRLVPPGVELVYWVEHVVRTGGALHLRSLALTTPWYQKYYLDLAVVIIASVCAMKLITTKLIGVFSKGQQKKKMY